VSELFTNYIFANLADIILFFRFPLPGGGKYVGYLYIGEQKAEHARKEWIKN
jgi:hypothetical protein